MFRVVFKSPKYEMQKVKFTKMLRYEYGLSLKAAKSQTDSLLEGSEQEILLENEKEAQLLVEKAKKLGVICVVEKLD